MFLPTTDNEIKALGWPDLDVILITGDTYIDSPFIGVALIGKVLLNAGFRVGIIAQPDITSARDIMRLGEPTLFWGVTSGCMDSMIANYTATKKWRKQDDLTAGGINNRRPDMAVIVYCNLIRQYFKKSKPIIIGGLEASLRRISHYDYWSNNVRRSILFDARADVLVYGMAENTILEIADRLSRNEPINKLRGTCVIGRELVPEYVELPAHKDVAQQKEAFSQMFQAFEANTDPDGAQGLCQKQDTRYLIHHPPSLPLTSQELDLVYGLNFQREVHPWYQKQGPVRGLETFQFAITTHRGCFGQCTFCSIAAHQGRDIVNRSIESIISEAKHMTKHHHFKGIIQNVGGPTANMYGMGCKRPKTKHICKRKQCLVPNICRNLNVNHGNQVILLNRIRKLSGIRKAFVASGLRHDLVLQDMKNGDKYLEILVRHHISGQMKLAPEHCTKEILKLMGKPGIDKFTQFKAKYDRLNDDLGKKQFVTCYFMAAFPGCTIEDMRTLNRFVRDNLKFMPEQIQIFTPSPSTSATSMYHTQIHPLTKKKLFVEKNFQAKQTQKNILIRPVKKKGT